AIIGVWFAVPTQRGGRAVRTTGSRRLAAWRSVAGILLASVSVAASVLVSPVLLAGSVRDVPRSHLGPEVSQVAQLSPLSAYRDFFEGERYSQPLLTVEAPDGITRIRFATLDHYDGARMSLGGDRQLFTRVPQSLPLG